MHRRIANLLTLSSDEQLLAIALYGVQAGLWLLYCFVLSRLGGASIIYAVVLLLVWLVLNFISGFYLYKQLPIGVLIAVAFCTTALITDLLHSEARPINLVNQYLFCLFLQSCNVVFGAFIRWLLELVVSISK